MHYKVIKMGTINLDQFMETVESLYEPEYGDFKRKVGLYLSRLEESDPSFRSGDKRKVMDQIRNEVLFVPIGNIEMAKYRTLELALRLKD